MMYGQNGLSHWFSGGFGFMHGPLGLLFTLLLCVAVIAVAVKIFQALIFPVTRSGSSESLNIVRRRYAAGEITKDEFEQIKKDIAEE